MSTEPIPTPVTAAATALPQRAVVLPFVKPEPGIALDQTGAALGVDNPHAAVNSLNQYLAERRTDLNFRVDHDTGTVVVSIVDAQTGTVLRQMPSEEALRIARYIDSGHGGSSLVHQQA